MVDPASPESLTERVEPMEWILLIAVVAGAGDSSQIASYSTKAECERAGNVIQQKAAQARESSDSGLMYACVEAKRLKAPN